MGKFKNSLIADNELNETLELQQISFVGLIDIFKSIQSEKQNHLALEEEDLDYISPEQQQLAGT